jgi:hypothetical protein
MRSRGYATVCPEKQNFNFMIVLTSKRNPHQRFQLLHHTLEFAQRSIFRLNRLGVLVLMFHTLRSLNFELILSGKITDHCEGVLPIPTYGATTF